MKHSKMNTLTSWNKNPHCIPIMKKNIYWQNECDILEKLSNTYIAYGMGRSYGDCCLPNNGISVNMTKLNKFLFFDGLSGILRVESGVTIKTILNFLFDKNWILPVVPGTQYVTVAGAIANDVHGKNHHKHGTFGCSVLKIGLLRSHEKLIECSQNMHSEFFSATIGGLGLTGMILWAEIQLKKIPSPYLLIDTQPFYSLSEYFELSNHAEKKHEYVAAWIDCQAQKNGDIRGILHCGTWCEIPTLRDGRKKRSITLPFYFPDKILNVYSVKLFNRFYFNRHKKKQSPEVISYGKYLFPLDGILGWNKLYGKKGFYQYQCVIPHEKAALGMQHLLDEISVSRQGSFLSVLKQFSDIQSPGMMSFPVSGCTLALDFPNYGKKTLRLFERLDTLLLQYNGRLYPAKDARMSSFMFKTTYPQWAKFVKYIDPQCHSLFWERVMS